MEPNKWDAVLAESGSQSLTDKPASQMTLREYAAIKFAAALLHPSRDYGPGNWERDAVESADALIAELERANDGQGQ